MASGIKDKVAILGMGEGLTGSVIESTSNYRNRTARRSGQSVVGKNDEHGHGGHDTQSTSNAKIGVKVR